MYKEDKVVENKIRENDKMFLCRRRRRRRSL